MININNISFYIILQITILSFLYLTPVHLSAQANKEFILNDADFTGYQVDISLRKPEAKISSSLTLSLPFFDDFSHESAWPDTSMWVWDTLRMPYITRTLAFNPPSLGAIVMDGSNRKGSYYNLPSPNPPYPEGKADYLTSQAIDLSAYSPADSLYLSFWYQPKGLGNEPEFGDSLLLYFQDTSTAPKFIGVWGIPGQPYSGFRQVLIPITNPLFFHDHFQFRLVNRATLTGQLDHWMIDYVYLNTNRNAGDSLYNDQSPNMPTSSLFFPYTQITHKQYATFWWERFQTFSINLRHLGTGLSNRTLVSSISELKHNALLSGTTSYNDPIQLSPGYQAIAYAPYSPQALFDYLYLRHTTLLDLPDIHPENDTIRTNYAIDSVLAYDDANPDAAYGLNTSRTFAQRYQLLMPDSVMGVYVCFIKTIYNVNIPQSYVITVYDGDDFAPGNILYEQFAAAIVGDSINQFFYVKFDSLIPVNTRMWLGIRQTDIQPIGIGVDFNNANTAIKWDSLQNWVPSQVNGTLLLRPVLSGGQPIPYGRERDQIGEGVNIYPNPVRAGGQLHLSEAGEILNLISATGQEIFLNTDFPSPLPEGIAPGFYGVKIRTEKGLEVKSICIIP